MGSIGPGFIAIVGGIITLAMLAVVVSQKAQSSTVIQAGGTALAAIIGAAVAPVTGSTSTGFGSTGAPTATG